MILSTSDLETARVLSWFIYRHQLEELRAVGLGVLSDIAPPIKTNLWQTVSIRRPVQAYF